jgi:hypothetical protein
LLIPNLRSYQLHDNKYSTFISIVNINSKPVDQYIKFLSRDNIFTEHQYFYSPPPQIFVKNRSQIDMNLWQINIRKIKHRSFNQNQRMCTIYDLLSDLMDFHNFLNHKLHPQHQTVPTIKVVSISFCCYKDD